MVDSHYLVVQATAHRDLSTSALPDGWRERLAGVQNANTAAPAAGQQFTGGCLDTEDLRVAKLCALLDAGLVDAAVIAARLPMVPERLQAGAQRAIEWLAARRA